MPFVVDSFSVAQMEYYLADAVLGIPTTSVTLYVNPTDIFVAQVALAQVSVREGWRASAYISEITLANGDHIEFNTFPIAFPPSVIESAWTQSATFVLEASVWGGTVDVADYVVAVASVTNYSLT